MYTIESVMHSQCDARPAVNFLPQSIATFWPVPKLYHFPHKKWVALKRAGWCDVVA